MRFEQWAHNPACSANTLSAVHNVRMDEVAKALNIPVTFGQSPFALARGNRFEASLLDSDAERLLPELVRQSVLADGASGLLDLRLKMNGGPRVVSVDDALARTREFLLSLPDHGDTPALVAAPMVTIPKGVMLPEALLIIDALAVRPTDDGCHELVVGEIKIYPDRGGHTDPAQLAGARAQAGVYQHAVELAVAELRLEELVQVSKQGFIVLSRRGSNAPSVRVEDLTFQALRAERGFEQLERAAQALVHGPALEETKPEVLAAIIAADTAYSQSCVTFCDMVPECHRRAVDAGDPAVLGDDTRRLLGVIPLQRAGALACGAAAADPSEELLLRRLAVGADLPPLAPEAP